MYLINDYTYVPEQSYVVIVPMQCFSNDTPFGYGTCVRAEDYGIGALNEYASVWSTKDTNLISKVLRHALHEGLEHIYVVNVTGKVFKIKTDDRSITPEEVCTITRDNYRKLSFSIEFCLFEETH